VLNRGGFANYLPCKTLHGESGRVRKEGSKAMGGKTLYNPSPHGKVCISFITILINGVEEEILYLLLQ
jgi:hypothetical protein